MPPSLSPYSLSPSLPQTIYAETSAPVISPQLSPTSPGPTFPSYLSETTLRPSSSPIFDNSLLPTTPPSPELGILTSMPSPEPDDASTSLPSLPGSTVLPTLDEKPGMQGPEETFLSNAEVAGPDEIRYTCGEGYQVEQSDTSIPISAVVAFDYEIHNEIDITVVDALKDVKMSILQDVADLIQCDITYSVRRLQSGFDNIIGLWSDSHDLPDPVAPGCIVDVDTSDPTTCTPVSGSFTFFVESGVSEASMDETKKSLLTLVQTNMDAGQYESGIVAKAIYIGDRDKVSKSPVLSEAMRIHTEGESKSNKALMIAVYVLSAVCILLICLVCIAARTRREKTVGVSQGRGSEMTFRSFMTQRDGSQNDPESQRGSGHPWQHSQPLWQREQPQRNLGPHKSMPMQNPNFRNTFQPRREVASSLPATTTRRYDDGQDELHGAAALSSLWNQRSPVQDDEAMWNHRSPVQDDEIEAYPPVINMPPVIPGGDNSSSSDSSDSSTDDSDETEQIAAPVLPRSANDNALNGNSQSFPSFNGNQDGTPAFNNSAKSLQSESSTAREERQERLARARARSAGRQSRRLS